MGNEHLCNLYAHGCSRRSRVVSDAGIDFDSADSVEQAIPSIHTEEFAMNLLKRIMKLRKKTVENPVYRNVGYWNGICPHCSSHVGVNVLENLLTRKQHMFCAVCKKDMVP